MRLASIVKSLDDAIIAKTLDGTIVSWNSGAEKIYGYSAKDVQGRPISILVPPDRSDEMPQILKRLKRGEHIDHFETVRMRRDGKRIHVSLAISPIKDTSGKIIGASTIAREITGRKQREEELQLSERELSIRNQIDEIFLTIPDEEMYPEVLQVILGALQSKYGVFGYIDQNGAIVYPSMTRDIWDKCQVLDKNIVFPRQKWGGVWSLALIEKKTIFSNEHSQVPEGHIPITRSIAVPIIHQENVIGLIQVANKSTDYDENDRRLLENIAGSTAPILAARLQRDREEKARKQAEKVLRIARNNLEKRVEERTAELAETNEELQIEITERKRAEEKLQHSLEQLRKTAGGIIQAITLTVETRDPYTGNHQRQVTSLAHAIADEICLSEEQIDGIRMAGVIHDLGKIAIPVEILSKPGPLTKIEFNLIRTHPQVGYDILKTIKFPWPIAQIVLQHHERLNGSGYPGGLLGEDILLEARIIAVADVVEGIASHRPYRSALGIDKALEEISQNKGILYDTRVVDACQRLFTEKGFNF